MGNATALGPYLGSLNSSLYFVISRVKPYLVCLIKFRNNVSTIIQSDFDTTHLIIYLNYFGMLGNQSSKLVGVIPTTY